MRVAITVDFEPDCPPFLNSSFRGIEEGAPALLDLFSRCGIPATYFTTGEVADRYPNAVRDVVAANHELACHGVTHSDFTTLDRAAARWEIEQSARTLREFAPVTSFRAPYLKFPESFVSLLEASAFDLDASLAKYKWSYRAPRAESRLARVAASMTSSVLRLPGPIRKPILLALADPVVLFVHPWEFVDLTKTSLRYDCRFRTGRIALECLEQVIDLFAERDASFMTMRDIASTPRVAE
ncbi:MAG: polysaccharide deacetylase family protein [Gemmatimonadota bacterium]